MSGLPLSLLAVSHLYLHRLPKLVLVDFQYKPAIVLRIVVNKQWRVYLDFGRASLKQQ